MHKVRVWQSAVTYFDGVLDLGNVKGYHLRTEAAFEALLGVQTSISNNYYWGLD